MKKCLSVISTLESTTLKRVFAFIILTVALSLTLNGGTIDIYVGYADDLRPSPFFPNPWSASASTALFAGNASNIDSAAVMIVNNTGASITLNSFSVNVPFCGGNCTATWASFLAGGFALANGKDAIFTQTSPYNFDASDTSNGLSLNTAMNCDPANPYAIAHAATCASIAPIITLGVNGNPTTNFTDSGQVMNTGGYDFVNSNPCPVAGDSPGNCNESLEWRLIGTTGPSNPGGGAPEPATFVLLGGGLGGLFFAKRYLARKA